PRIRSARLAAGTAGLGAEGGRAGGGTGIVRNGDRRDADLPRGGVPWPRAAARAARRGAAVRQRAHHVMGFGGVALVLSFGLLYQRRLAGLINVYAMQALAVSAAAAW